MNNPRYRKLCTRTWGGKAFRALSPLPPSGQSLYLYLLLGPHTTAVPGLWVLGEAGLAEALGWSQEDLRRCWAELDAQGLAEADWKARVVWMPSALDGNEPQSPKQVLGWRAALDDVPDCPLKAKALAALFDRLQERSALRPTLLQVLRPLQESVCHTDADSDPDTRSRNRSRSSISLPYPSQEGGLPEREGDFVTTEEKKFAPPPGSGEDVNGQASPEEKKQAAAAGTQDATARRVVEHYERVVKPQRAAPGAMTAVLALLEAGRTEENLYRCADGYASACRRSNQDPAYRQGAGKFYGEGGYLDYLGWQPPAKPKRPAPVPLPRSLQGVATIGDVLAELSRPAGVKTPGGTPAKN